MGAFSPLSSLWCYFFLNGGLQANEWRVTKEYKRALADNCLTAYNGDDASAQPGNLQEVLLHETAVAWVRHREKTVRPVRPWEETPAQYATRLRSIFQDINDNLDVEGLCWSPRSDYKRWLTEGGRIPSHLSE